MKQTKLSRVLSPLFEWDLACNKQEHEDIKSMLKELKQKARDLQHRASATHDRRSQRAIKQKQQIIHTYRCKALTLLRECQLRRQKI
jgi:hypothetical protein